MGRPQKPFSLCILAYFGEDGLNCFFEFRRMAELSHYALLYSAKLLGVS
jgi:hypothetical protein